MKTLVMEATQCPVCGRPLQAGALAELCPSCLLAQGAETQPAGAGPSDRFQPPPIEELAQLFPKLEILGLLGSGGMGAVYKARQSDLDRFVALKILPAGGHGGTNFAERFNREARALARLNHPNIVSVHEFGQAGGLHFFIMEFVDGSNLRQLERAARLSPREALQIVPQICDALQYAHDEGVVHRDIKPENVLVDRKGRVKIADFGLAKILGQDTEALRLTAEGQVMGTPHYMAPEQLSRPLAVDHRADIYALGVVLYEMLTGDLPLGNFSPPSRKVQVDVRLDEVVLRALQYDPERRYQQASEVKSRVESISSAPATPPAAATPTSDPGPSYLGWAGFPVVADLPDGRIVHWKGALIALALTFGLLTLAFAFVSAFTGGSLYGWVGVIGWPSVATRLGLAVLLVGLGIQLALVSKRTGEPLPPSAVIFPSSRRQWAIGRIAVRISVLVLAWCIFQVQWLSPWLHNSFGSSRRVQAAVHDNRTGTFVANLPGGGAVELLALSDQSAAPNEWWRPDGSLLRDTAFDAGGLADSLQPALRRTDLIFRTTGLSQQTGMPLVESEPAANLSVGGHVHRDGSDLAGGWPVRAAWPTANRKATFRLGYGLAPWRTVVTHRTADGSVTSTPREGDPHWSASINHVSDNGRDVLLTMVLQPEDRNWKTRVIAVDANGAEHASSSANGLPSGPSATWTYIFRGLTMSQLEEFRVQVQPLHWVEFRDVELAPDHPNNQAGDPDNASGTAGRTVEELPPVVVGTHPMAGAREVAPGLTEIRIRFSKDMAEGLWSCSGAWLDSAPEIVGTPQFEADRRTCVVTAKLEPARTYACWLNSETVQRFADSGGQPAVPYLLIFQTRQN